LSGGGWTIETRMKDEERREKKEARRKKKEERERIMNKSSWPFGGETILKAFGGGTAKAVPPGQSLRARKAGLRGLWHTPSCEGARLIPPLAGPEHLRNATIR